MTSSDKDFLELALGEAQIRRGFTSPNPAVGAVVVRDGKVLAKGFHVSPGLGHAEVEALSRVSDAKGATVYVTLEPCCHFGKTPPCTDLLISRGVSRVVYGYPDANPKVGGKGAEILRKAGIEVLEISLPEIQEFYRSYSHWWKTKRPFTIAKLALSQDGKVAGPEGARVFLTGEEANRFTHEQRKRADVLVTSGKTVERDDPQMTVRLANQELKKPIAIIDRTHRMPPKAKVKENGNPFHVYTVGPLKSIWEDLGKKGYSEAWVEVGPQMLRALLAEGLLDRLYIYQCQKTVGEGVLGISKEEIEQWKSTYSYRSFQLGPDLAMCFDTSGKQT